MVDIINITQNEVVKTAPDIGVYIKEYCSSVNTNILWVIGVAMFLWIFEKKLEKLLANYVAPDNFMGYVFSKESILFMYRWIGVGLLFMSGYFIWIMAHAGV
jgi:hypothetical protein